VTAPGATFYSLALGQLALVAFGVLLVSGEYTSGTINASLAAVPRRGLLYGSKVLTGMLVALAASLVTVAGTALAAEAELGVAGQSSMKVSREQFGWLMMAPPDAKVYSMLTRTG